MTETNGAPPRIGWRVALLGGALATVAALWLFAMAVVMPLTGGGLFATELPQDAMLVNACYLAIALTWLTSLLAVRALALRPAPGAVDAPALDRARGAGLAGAPALAGG